MSAHPAPSRPPLVSVVMPLYNAARYVGEAFASIDRQTYPNIEIVAVNDGSTDDTAARVGAHSGRCRIRYVEQPNRGVSAARNAGLRAATGELIAFLDHDDRWLPQKLQAQVDYLERNPTIGLVHSKISFMDAEGRPLANHVSDFVPGISGWCFEALFAENKIATLTVCMRRACFEKVGFFREDIRGAEDYEYWLRVSRHFEIGMLDDTLAVYRLHAGSATRNWLPQLIDLGKALEGVLEQFPEARSQIASSAVRRRLGPIHARVARELCRTGQHQAALPHLRRALALRPTDRACWGLFLMASLPASVRTAVRWYWQRLFG